MMILAALAFLFSTLAKPVPPDTVSLQYCYQQAYDHYPIAKNIELQHKITALNVDIANSGYFPQINVSGKATYQSEVTSFSIAGGQGPPPISKDQYEASVDVTQTIFNAGVVGIQRKLQQAKGEQQVHSTEVKLHQIRSQVNQVYFGILLSGQQAETINLLIEDLNNQLSTIHSKVKNGVLLPSQEHILQAELIKARKDSADTKSNIKAGYSVLSELTGKDLLPQTGLALPETRVDYRSLQPQRPEYEQFESLREVLDQQKKLTKTQKWPHLAAFGTAAYGRPGLNFLNNDFHDYYIVGLQVKWNFWNAINGGRKAQALQLQKQTVTQSRRAFTKQLNAQLDRIRERISTIRENLDRDEKVVDLRDQIVDESSSQLRNGVITATEYITELRRANQAKLSLYINKVRLSQAQTDYITALGIPTQTKR